MPKMHISKSVVINAPIDKIYTSLQNFKDWTVWSPWLIMNPDTNVTVAEDGDSYEWDGARVGSGNMSIQSREENRSIDYNLTFLKPWKSVADVRFELKEQGEGVQVTWLMDSSLPFFMFWMKKMMVAFVGMDYQRGLNMLKEYMEKGEIDSKLEFRGESTFEGCKYIGVKSYCAMDDMGDQMMSDFARLGEVIQKEGIKPGKAFTIYHKWEMVKQQAEFTSGWEVDSIPENLPEGVFSSEMPTTKVYTLRHVGAYQHLGNAWTTLYNMQRGKEFKQNKKTHPFEVYINNPQEVAEKDLITDVNFAVK